MAPVQVSLVKGAGQGVWSVVQFSGAIDIAGTAAAGRERWGGKLLVGRDEWKTTGQSCAAGHLIQAALHPLHILQGQTWNVKCKT